MFKLVVRLDSSFVGSLESLLSSSGSVKFLAGKIFKCSSGTNQNISIQNSNNKNQLFSLTIHIYKLVKLFYPIGSFVGIMGCFSDFEIFLISVTS